MNMKLADLPEQFFQAIIMGEFRQAVCVGGDKEFILRLEGDEIVARETGTLDNIHMTLRMASSPLILEDVSREDLVEALHKQMQMHAPLPFLTIGLERDMSLERRIESLAVAKSAWTEAGSVLCRSRVLSGYVPQNYDVDGAIELCRTQDFPEFVALFEELKEALPCMKRVSAVFQGKVRARVPADVNNRLLDRGLLAEAVLGLARNDFAALDEFIEGMGSDEALKPYQGLIEDFGRYLRDSALRGLRKAAEPGAEVS